MNRDRCTLNDGVVVVTARGLALGNGRTPTIHYTAITRHRGNERFHCGTDADLATLWATREPRSSFTSTHSSSRAVHSRFNV